MTHLTAAAAVAFVVFAGGSVATANIIYYLGFSHGYRGIQGNTWPYYDRYEAVISSGATPAAMHWGVFDWTGSTWIQRCYQTTGRGTYGKCGTPQNWYAWTCRQYGWTGGTRSSVNMGWHGHRHEACD
jgi:hypothetical protein